MKVFKLLLGILLIASGIVCSIIFLTNPEEIPRLVEWFFSVLFVCALLSIPIELGVFCILSVRGQKKLIVE